MGGGEEEEEEGEEEEEEGHLLIRAGDSNSSSSTLNVFVVILINGNNRFGGNGTCSDQKTNECDLKTPVSVKNAPFQKAPFQSKLSDWFTVSETDIHPSMNRPINEPVNRGATYAPFNLDIINRIGR